MTTTRYKNSTLITGFFCLTCLLGCTEPNEAADHMPSASGGTDGIHCIDNGRGLVKGSLFGSVEQDLSWPNDGTQCEGMSRPGGNGARLRFARTYEASDDSLVLIIGVAGMAPGTVGNGFGANVTLIDERESSFYSNSGVPNCWVDIYKQTPVGADKTQVDGILYCSGALASKQGNASVRARDIKFSGIVNWAEESAATPLGAE